MKCHYSAIFTAIFIAVGAIALANQAQAETLSFRTKVDYPVGVNPSSVSLADLNNDGTPDMVVGYEENQTTSAISVLFGKANGTFSAKVDSAIPQNFKVRL